MRWLLAFILLCSVSARAATGDIVDEGNITSIGVAEVRIDGFVDTNTPFYNGLQNVTNYATYDGTNEIWFQQPGPTNALTITLLSWGYWCGTNYAWPRTVYGTKLARKPYPNQAQSAIVTNIGPPNAARESVWINDYIYTTDSNLVGAVRANAFASNNAITGLSFSNNSTIPPWTPKVAILNYGEESIINSNYVSRVVAYDHHRIDGVGVTLTHTNGQTKSNYTMVRVADNRYTRGQNAAVFKNSFDLADWTNALFTVDVSVKPTIGAEFTTFDNLYPNNMPQIQRQTNLLNHYGLLTAYYGVYDAGAAGPGAATNVPFAEVSPVHYFNSPMVASRHSAASNSYRGGMVLFTTGSTNVAGTATFVRDVDSRIIWDAAPGNTFSLATNTVAGGFGFNPGGKLQINNCLIQITNITLLDNCERVALSNCIVDSFNYPFRASSVNTIIYAEATKFTKLGGGIRGFSSDRIAWQLYGCDLNGFTNTLTPWLFIGNYHTNSASTNFIIDQGPSFLPFPPQQRIFAHNILKGLWGNSTLIGDFGDTVYASTNDAMVGNLIEGIAITGGAAKSLTLWASPTNMTGIVFQNNSIYGCRHQYGYNETGTGWKQISTKNNSIDVLGWVTDAIGGPNNASYTNNWWVMNGVGFWGNAVPDTSEVFHGDAEYAHFQSYFRPSSVRKPYSWWGIVERRALSSTTVYGLGNGDYHPMPYALTRTIPIDPLYEYDIELRPYTAFGSGVYATRGYTFISGSGTTTISGSGTTFIQP